jgi:hypothetical protein
MNTGSAAAQEEVHKRLVRLADIVGKTQANSAEVLVMFQLSERRVFALLVKGVYNPKIQIWASVVWSERNVRACDAEEVTYPFTVRLNVGGEVFFVSE